MTSALAWLIAGTTWMAPAVETRTIDYRDGDTVLEGFVANDTSKPGPKPVVFIVHDWDGLTDYEMSRAKQLAELGYIGFAVDIYGKGVRPKSMQENAAQAGKYRGDLPLFRSRLTAALNEAKRLPGADPNRIVGIGYCFGGTGVLELARAGAELRGVVSFHGGLGTSSPAAAGAVRTKVLVAHAINDPAVPRPQFNAFLDEFNAAKVDYQVLVLNEDVHPFTVPGPQYRPDADRRSWSAFRTFLDEVLK